MREQGSDLPWLLLAAVVICIVGLLDDYRGLRGRYKLLGQLTAIAIVMRSGLLVEHVRFLHWEVELGLMAVPFTVFWLLGAINSLNLIDGMDGLLSCVGIIICLAMAAMAVLGDHWVAACVAVALGGALLGFLRYNFPPASIFLGDTGSMLIGLVVGVLAIHSSLKGPATIALAAPLAVLTIPIFDTAAAITRRRLTGRSICSTDRGHLHHCLLRRGLSPRNVLLCVSFFCSLTLAGVLTSLIFQNEIFALFSALIVVGILLVFRLFGYAELVLVKQRLAAIVASVLPSTSATHTHQTEVQLQGSADYWKKAWERLTACARELNLRAVRLDVNAPALHESYHARWDNLDDQGTGATVWRTDVPLMAWGQTVGHLGIVGERDHESLWQKIAVVAKFVEDFESHVSALSIGSETSGASLGPLQTTSSPEQRLGELTVPAQVRRAVEPIR